MRSRFVQLIFALIVLFNVGSSFGDNPLPVNGRIKHTTFPKIGSLLSFNIFAFVQIDQDNFEIGSTRNESIQGLNSKSNDDIEFLPVKVYEKFPNLIAYQFKSSAVRSVEYKHFEKLKELESISLIDNQILQITNDAFKDSPKLKYLNLNENLLVDICFIDSITSLWMVDFTANQIEHLQSDAFEHLTELRNVSLQINKLTSFDANYFANNKKLEFIWIDNNQFKSINPLNFEDKKNLIYVDLRGNKCINDYYRNFTEMRIQIDEKCVKNIDAAAENIKCR
ncbi:hypothetical protein ACKWTF_003208 [Chironomus riparius]